MRRSTQNFVIGSASAIAIAAVLAACSQPASYAVVDLSGSYGQSQQAYSARTGEPVYSTSTALYGPQSYPEYVPNSQLAYTDAPTNQVASLGNGPGQFDTYGVVPTYEPQAFSAPVVSETPLLSSPEFQTEIAQVEPLAQYENIGPLDAAAPAPAPVYEAAPTPVYEAVGDAETAYAAPAYENYGDIYQPAPQSTMIESAPLGEIESAPLPDLIAEQMPPQPGVGDDYVTWTQPQESPIAETVLGPVADAPAPEPVWQAPADTETPYKPDTAFVNEAADLLPPKPQQTRMPAPQAVPKRALENTGTAPKASGAYPRPYELLRPGIYPEIGAAGEGMVQAPLTTPMPVMAFVQRIEQSGVGPSIDQASTRSYTIQSGDTLYGIAQRAGLPLEALLSENGLTSDAIIKAGEKISIPARRSQEEAALEAAPSEFADAELPSISAETARDVLAQPIERASVPTVAKTEVKSRRFSWPVHGEVYKLGAGQIEIDPSGKAPVGASAPGRVVHVERGPLGVLVVIEHADGWRSLTVGLEVAHVRVGETVAQGAPIGRASRDHRVRFELRDASSGVADALSQLQG